MKKREALKMLEVYKKRNVQLIEERRMYYDFLQRIKELIEIVEDDAQIQNFPPPITQEWVDSIMGKVAE